MRTAYNEFKPRLLDKIILPLISDENARHFWMKVPPWVEFKRIWQKEANNRQLQKQYKR